MILGAGPRAWALEEKQGMLYRTLGRTGERISAIGLGGYHIGNPPEQEGIRIIRTAIDGGITFMDNCWDYHDGGSEMRMGKALRDGYRQKVFLMTKIDGQTRETAARQIDQSLQRLQTDHVDLMQCHEVIRPGDPDRIFGPGGSIEALLAAKETAPEIARMFLASRFAEEDWARLEALGAVALGTNHRKLEPANVERLHEKGYRVVTYTVNDAEVAQGLFDAGVDGIVTDNLREFATRFPAAIRRPP
jgi:aryl-alcohol dehydrogenase-like predicted oxidoreductase